MGELKKDIVVARVKVCLSYSSLILIIAFISNLYLLWFQEKCARELEIAKEEGQIARDLEMKKVPYTLTRP